MDGQFNPDELRKIGEHDRMVTAMNDMAAMMAHYYKCLLQQGVPSDVAGKLTLGFQKTCADIIASNHQNDK